MPNNLHRETDLLLALATLVVVAMVHMTPVHAQDADITKQLQGVDLTGVKQLKLSPDGELAAGLTKLYSNPGARSGSFSLFKIWSVQEQELLHQIRVPAEAYEIVFSPDSSTVVTAEKKGDLGRGTTVRAWDRAGGKERKLGTSVGKIAEHCFSPDGSQWATLTQLSLWDHPSSVIQINVWPVAGKGKPVSIDISHPLGWVELRPPVESWEDKLWQVVPMHVRFSPDGQQLICKTETGLRTIYDSRTGKLLEHANVSSVGMVESVLMIALHQAPDDAKSLTLDIAPNEKSIELQRAADGWWRAGKDGKIAFKVNGEHFASLINGVEKQEHIVMGLGLKDGTKLENLSSFKHPLGVVMINRDEAGLTFRLEEVKDGTEPGQTLQTGEVQWGPPVEDQ